MNKKIKNILTWILTIIVILVGGYFYAYIKDDTLGIIVWDLETMVVFCLGAFYLVGLSRLLMWLFRK